MRESAVLLLTFNRPDTTEKVLHQIRQYRPRQLFVAGDGPRNLSDATSIVEVKRLVREIVDWDCELRTSYSEANLGCRRGVVRAIDWFFAQVAEGIILEDDCVPHPEFFEFCENMLERYRDDDRVLHISGDNSAQVSLPSGDSYTFVRYPHVWGWATWSRAWKFYDRHLEDFHQAVSQGKMKEVFPNRNERNLWVPILESVRETEKPDTWAWPWAATLFLRNGLSVQPTVNLISNIGFDNRATHTMAAGPRSAFPSGEIFPLKHPPRIVRNGRAERQIFWRTQIGIDGRTTFFFKASTRLRSLLRLRESS